MDLQDMMRLDRIVSDALGKRRGESIADAAMRVLRERTRFHPAHRVAASVLVNSDDVWADMKRAASLTLGVVRS